MTTRKRTPRSTRPARPTGALKALAESKKSPTILLKDLQTHAVKRAQADNSRRQDIIHPSEMAKEDWCARATSYRIRGIARTDPDEVHHHQLLTIFEEGHEIHSKWQTWLGEMGRLWGLWRCPVCGHEETDVGVLNCRGEEGVDEHNTVPMEYKEIPLDAEAEWMISGHADGGVPDLRALIEIKSIGLGTLRIEEPELVKKYTLKTAETGKSVVDLDNLWKAIKRPLKGHRKQAGIYLAIANLRGYPLDKMIFLYEYKANQSTKEFVIEFDEDMVSDLIEMAKDIKWSVETGRDLPRIENAAQNAKPCKTCPWKTWCWAEEEDDGESTTPTDITDGGSLEKGEDEAGPAADLHAKPTRRVSRTPRRPDRTGRQRTDAVDDSVHAVGRVPRSAVGGSGGRRSPRRRVPRSDQGS